MPRSPTLTARSVRLHLVGTDAVEGGVGAYVAVVAHDRAEVLSGAAVSKLVGLVLALGLHRHGQVQGGAVSDAVAGRGSLSSWKFDGRRNLLACSSEATAGAAPRQGRVVKRELCKDGVLTLRWVPRRDVKVSINSGA